MLKLHSLAPSIHRAGRLVTQTHNTIRLRRHPKAQIKWCRTLASRKYHFEKRPKLMQRRLRTTGIIQTTKMLGRAAMQRILMASTIAMIATAVSAQQPTDAQRSAIRLACRSDYMAHCAKCPDICAYWPQILIACADLVGGDGFTYGIRPSPRSRRERCRHALEWPSALVDGSQYKDGLAA
jgi:hypothetical protein